MKEPRSERREVGGVWGGVDGGEMREREIDRRQNARLGQSDRRTDRAGRGGRQRLIEGRNLLHFLLRPLLPTP